MSGEPMGVRVCSYPGLIYVITVDILQLLYCNHRQTVDDSRDSDKIKDNRTVNDFEIFVSGLDLSCLHLF